MIAQAQQHMVLPDSVSTLAVAALLFAAAAAWVGLHLLSGRIASAKLRLGLFAVRVAAVFAVLMVACQLALRGMLLTTSWRLWPIALGGGLAIEVLLGLYALERRTISRRAGLALASLRVALVLLVIGMLTQPVLSWELVERIQRYVAVLIDESASMHVRDPQRSAAEKLRLAEMLSVRAARRQVRLDVAARELADLRAELVAVGDDLAPLADADGPSRQKQLEGRRADLFRLLSGQQKVVERHLAQLDRAAATPAKLDDALKNALRNAKAQLVVGVRDRLAKAIKIADGGNEAALGRDYPRLLEAVRGATAALAKLSGELEPLGEAFDERIYAALSEPQRDQIVAATGKSRLALAREVLQTRRVTDFDKKTSEPSLLARIAGGYKVKVYKFAADCVEGDLARLGGPDRPATAPASSPASSPASAPAGRAIGEQSTNLARAIERVATEMSGKQLAAVVMLLDGRHNAEQRVEPLASQLGLQKVPLCSIVMAPTQPPRDAAVVFVGAAQTVTERDKFLVDAELKLDGLAGQNVEVALFDAKRQVATKTVHVPKNVHSFRPRVRFTDEPKGAGLHPYSVRIKPLNQEVFADNNEYPLTVSVTKDRVRLLALEDRPRWEFRYIKNIFSDRDRNVKLQYVLANPDRITGQRAKLKVAASASRSVGKVEATLLPASASEWMKFDAIILGDMPPGAFTPEQLDMIRKFVTERGGTLIVVAGPNFMPHAYAGTPLEDLLPVRFEPSEAPIDGGVKTGYRIALTAAGKNHTIMFQKVNPEENLKVWNTVPEIYWRHPGTVAKEAAQVLAFAMPASPPEFLRELPPEKAGDEQLLRQREAKRRRFEHDNSLIALHQVAAGRVLMLCFDRTWRLRYRVGDTHHHRFWGQLMRWATADKLRAGTDFVKLGTDRTRYAADKEIRVRAKIVQPDLTPVISENVAVKVFADGKQVLRKRMEYRAESPGMYEAKLQPLASGTYRIELEAPEAAAILAADKVKKVATEFSVDPVGSAEEVELSADRGLLQRLANLSGGVVLDPHQADEVLASLGPKNLERREHKELRLWDAWPLLVLIVLLASVEWMLRKRLGLA